VARNSPPFGVVTAKRFQSGRECRDVESLPWIQIVHAVSTVATDLSSRVAPAREALIDRVSTSARLATNEHLCESWE
jgi:hypothetical protein